MNNYLKLVNFEVKRFSKLFLAVVAGVVIAQIIGAFVTALTYMNHTGTRMKREQMLESEFVLNYGPYSLQNFIYSEYFILSLVFAAAILIIYVFFIWYRDWLGKSSFIYRLLMLPTERRNVYFAKLTTILLFVLCLVGVQIVLLEVVIQITHSIVPESLRTEQGTIYIYWSEVLNILYPQTLLHFILYYGLGATIVAIVFTAILFERSYHLKGVFFAILYIAISIIVIITPVLIQFITGYLYENEIILLTVGSSMIAIAFAIYLADYLLKRKINV